MAAALAEVPIRLYGAEHTIEDAAKDLAQFAAGRPCALFADSQQTVRSSRKTDGPRERIEAVAAAQREAAELYRMISVSTSEANRASYRNAEAATSSNDLAAGAESRAIEFSAQTLLMLRTPKDHPDIIHVRVAKNRRASTGEFWLRIDREKHSLTQCEDPTNTSTSEDTKRTERRRNILQDAQCLAKVLDGTALGERELRAALRVAGYGWGTDRTDAAKKWLRDCGVALAVGRRVRLVDATPDNGKRSWRLEPAEAPPEAASGQEISDA